MAPCSSDWMCSRWIRTLGAVWKETTYYYYCMKVYLRFFAVWYPDLFPASIAWEQQDGLCERRMSCGAVGGHGCGGVSCNLNQQNDAARTVEIMVRRLERLLEDSMQESTRIDADNRGVADESTVMLTGVETVCEDIRETISHVEAGSSSLFAWSCIGRLKDLYVRYCGYWVGRMKMDGCVLPMSLITCVYDTMASYARLASEDCTRDAVHGCTMTLLQIHAILCSHEENDEMKSMHDASCGLNNFIIDELVEMLPCMERMAASLGMDGHLPDGWYESMMRGYLTLARETDIEILRINCLNNSKRLFERISSNPNLECEVTRLAMLCVEYHYEAAAKLPLEERAGIDDSGNNAACLRHSTEVITYGDYAMNDPSAVECTLDLAFIIHHARLLKATCLVNCGQLQDACRELSMMPECREEHDPRYSELHFDILILEIRVYTLLHAVDTIVQSLRSLVLLVKNMQLGNTCHGLGKGGFAERLGRTLLHIFQHIGISTKAENMDQCLEVVELIVALLQGPTSVGVKAIMHVFITLPTAVKAPCSAFEMPLLYDVLTSSTVCALVRSDDDTNQDICWDSFKSMAHDLFLHHNVEASITFCQALLHYGPEKRKQIVFTILFSLYVYTRNYAMAEHCRNQLGSSMKEHPFVMGTMLLEQFEITQASAVVDQSTTSMPLEIEDIVVSDVSRYPGKWTMESVHAIRGIGELFGRNKLITCGLNSTAPAIHHSNPFKEFIVACKEISGETQLEKLIAMMQDTLNGILTLAESPRGIPHHKDDLLKDMIDAIQLMISNIGHIHIKNSQSASECFSTAQKIVKASLVLLGQSRFSRSQDLLGILKRHELSLHILQCNEYLNDLDPLDSMKKGEIISLLDESEKSNSDILGSQDAISLLKIRLFLLTGTFNDVIIRDIERIEQLLGDDCFSEFSVHHVAHTMIYKYMFPKALLQHLARRPGGLDSLFTSLICRVDDCKVFRLYLDMIQSIEGTEEVGRSMFSNRLCSSHLHCKVYFTSPWLFREYVTQTHLQTHNVSYSLEDTVAHSVSCESLSDSQEIDSPPIKQHAIEAASNLVSSLIKDLGEEEPPFNPSSNVDSTNDVQVGIWSKWIKKVLG